MFSPNSHPWSADETLGRHLEKRGVSRREFLEFCGGLCAMLGLDPLYVANEGIMVVMLPDRFANDAVAALRALPLGAHARRIGRVVDDHPGMVVMRTAMGGTRVVDMLPGDQLPRIC